MKEQLSPCFLCNVFPCRRFEHVVRGAALERRKRIWGWGLWLSSQLRLLQRFHHGIPLMNHMSLDWVTCRLSRTSASQSCQRRSGIRMYEQFRQRKVWLRWWLPLLGVPHTWWLQSPSRGHQAKSSHSGWLQFTGLFCGSLALQMTGNLHTTPSVLLTKQKVRCKEYRCCQVVVESSNCR